MSPNNVIRSACMSQIITANCRHNVIFDIISIMLREFSTKCSQPYMDNWQTYCEITPPKMAKGLDNHQANCTKLSYILHAIRIDLVARQRCLVGYCQLSNVSQISIKVNVSQCIGNFPWKWWPISSQSEKRYFWIFSHILVIFMFHKTNVKRGKERGKREKAFFPWDAS